MRFRLISLTNDIITSTMNTALSFWFFWSWECGTVGYPFVFKSRATVWHWKSGFELWSFPPSKSSPSRRRVAFQHPPIYITVWSRQKCQSKQWVPSPNPEKFLSGIPSAEIYVDPSGPVPGFWQPKLPPVPGCSPYICIAWLPIHMFYTNPDKMANLSKKIHPLLCFPKSTLFIRLGQFLYLSRVRCLWKNIVLTCFG